MGIKLIRLLLLITLAVSIFDTTPLLAQAQEVHDLESGDLQILNVEANLATVGRYGKFELTFDIAGTVATNPDWPYDPDPPPGVPAGTGISVEGLFSPDNWNTVYTQPAFLYQPYDYTVHNNWDHLYPAGDPVWKIRFAPPIAGDWQYRIRATDASGTVIYPGSGDATFLVEPSDSSGFLRVSPTDPRYFEFDDGTPFVGVGHAEGFDRLRPVQEAEESFSRFSDQRANFTRIWLSSYSIFGSAWWPWASHHLGYEAYLPATSLTTEDSYADGDVAMRLNMDNPCMRQGRYPVAVLPGRTYRVRARIKAEGITGPVQAGEPYGFVVKLGGWLGQECASYDAGMPVTPHVADTGGAWQIVTGTLTVNDYFLYVTDVLYLTLTNADGGTVYVDHVWLEEQTGPDTYGPNILPKPDVNVHTYFDPVRSWQWDQIMDEAEDQGVYLKLVVLEKNEWIFNRITASGVTTTDASNDNFYAAPNTRVRWLHQTWWRYLIARWGYSTAVHSWELLNEGDPFNGNHYEQAQAFAEYIHEHDPNRHMVTTSFWHSFPMDEFWTNPAYPDLDYVDLHAYVSTGWGEEPVLPDVAPNPLFYTDAEDYDGSGWSVAVHGSDYIYNSNLWSLDIQGEGEWLLRYRLKLDGWTGSCQEGDHLSGPRLIWWLQGGGGADRRNVVPPRVDGTDWRCSTPITPTGWVLYDSAHSATGEEAPLEARIVITDALSYNIAFGVQNSYGNGGTGYFDSVELVAPDGTVLPINGDIDLNQAMQEDAALYTAGYSRLWGGSSPAGAGKPLVRGEGGLDYPGGPQEEQADLDLDTEGVWLHNFVWAGINSGGMYDLYWWPGNIRDYDLYHHYRPFRDFLDGIPISNGYYEDARAVTPAGLRAWGQVDRTQHRGHLWVQNASHTWRNVVDGINLSDLGGTIGVPDVISGTYRVVWWDTWSGAPFLTQTVDTPLTWLSLPLPQTLTDDVALQWEWIAPTFEEVSQIYLPLVLKAPE